MSSRDQFDKRASFMNRLGFSFPDESDPEQVDKYLRLRKAKPCPECKDLDVVLEDGCATCAACGRSEVLYARPEEAVPHVAPNLLDDTH